MENTIKQIAVIEDEVSFAEHLKKVIDAEDDMVCQALYKDAEWGLKHLPEIPIDIVIVDIGLPGKNGIQCVKELKDLMPDTQFMMYTIFEQDDELFESLKVGASGYLLKKADDQEIIVSIRDLFAGGSPMSPSIARKVTEYFFKKSTSPKKMEVLSDRANEILALLAKGYLYKEISRDLGLTVGTVKQHIHRIYKKLHVNNKTEAINLYNGLE